MGRVLRACAGSGAACVTVTREPSSSSEAAALELRVDYFREGGEDLPVVVQVLGNRFHNVVRRAQRLTASAYPLEDAFLQEWENTPGEGAQQGAVKLEAAHQAESERVQPLRFGLVHSRDGASAGPNTGFDALGSHLGRLADPYAQVVVRTICSSPDLSRCGGGAAVVKEIGPGRSLSIAAAMGTAVDRRKAVALPPLALNSLNEVNDPEKTGEVDYLLREGHLAVLHLELPDAAERVGGGLLGVTPLTVNSENEAFSETCSRFARWCEVCIQRGVKFLW